ncbi:MAG: MotA/TolQ/ExbB proton channel family protein [Planctomycetota bacterium]
MLVLRCVAFAAESAEPAPVIRSVEPAVVSRAGRTRITILGAHFDTGLPSPARVEVGGEPCSEIDVNWQGTQIRAVVPPSRAGGAVPVKVINEDGQSATLEDAVYYDDGRFWARTWFVTRSRARSVWELLEKGGLIMALLGLLSVFAVAWAIHCALVVRSSRIMPQEFLDRLSGQIARREIQQAIDACQRERSVFSRVALAALRKAGEAPHKIREASQAAGSREASHLFQKISYLSNIGVISPMLGLLGTVMGMLMAFKAMGEEGGRSMALAAAIYKALGTTAVGLTIGIPAMACFYYFRGKLLQATTDMEQVAEELSDALAPGEEQE